MNVFLGSASLGHWQRAVEPDGPRAVQRPTARIDQIRVAAQAGSEKGELGWEARGRVDA